MSFMRKMVLMLIVLFGAMIVKSQGIPTPTSKENKGKLDSNLVVKFETSLDTVDKNFKAAIRSSDESDWMKEYTAKLAELKNNARDLQNEIMKTGIAKDCNMPKYVIVISESLVDCRKAYKNGKFDLALLDDNPVSLNNSSEDVLTKTGGQDNRRFAKGELALKSSYQDFKLAVAHLRENIVLLNKSVVAQKELDKVSKTEVDNVQLDAPDRKSKAVGRWTWPWGTMLLAEDGKATWINAEGPTDRATSWMEKDGIVSVTWAAGHVDTFKYNPAGTKAVLTESSNKQSNINKISKK